MTERKGGDGRKGERAKERGRLTRKRKGGYQGRGGDREGRGRGQQRRGGNKG